MDLTVSVSSIHTGPGVPLHPRVQPLVGGCLSVQAISWVIDHSKQKSNSFVVLLMIANHARSDGSGAWPSIRTLAKECRLSDRTVQRAIIALVKTRELRVTHNKGPFGANLYDLPGVKLTPPVTDKVEGGCQTAPILDDTAVSPNPSLSVLKDKEGTSLPSASAEEKYFTWCRETIGVQMGGRKRIPSLDAYQGARAEDVVTFLNGRGFSARILRTQ
jgi:hypothetical protein